MNFTKEHLSEVLGKHIEREKGLQELMELMIEIIMKPERREFLDISPGNKGNGYRQGKSYGQGRVLDICDTCGAKYTFYAEVGQQLHMQLVVTY